MKKITIRIIAQDHNNVRLEAEKPMIVSDKEYQDFLDDALEMIDHCNKKVNAKINSICKDMFAKIGTIINDQYDLKYVVIRYYSEDGKLRSRADYEHLKEGCPECQPFDQNGLFEFLKFAGDDYPEEELNQDK